MNVYQYIRHNIDLLRLRLPPMTGPHVKLDKNMKPVKYKKSIVLWEQEGVIGHMGG
tara:strand:+ start:118 stop:285 length:168 start_codon:yes stop_codon:yes gene_type:complete